jgi:hypothetical protein
MARDHFEVSQKSINLIGLDRQDSAFPGKKTERSCTNTTVIFLWTL